MSAKVTYQITYLAGKWVAGYRLPIGATTIELTPEEAEYDLRAGTIVAPGQPLPTRPDPAAVEDADVVALTRAGGARTATVADLVAYLVATGAVANGQTAAINAVVATLRGTADPDHNTLGKLAAIIAGLGIGDIAGLSAALATKATPADISVAVANLAGTTPAALDTLAELADALGDDPNFATTITNLLAGKQPLDADLSAIAALATTSFGRSLLTLSSLAAASVTPTGGIQGTLGDALRDRLVASRNLDALTDKPAARSNLGLGEVATMSLADLVAAVRDALNGKDFSA